MGRTSKDPVGIIIPCIITDFPAYRDTGYSDTPLTVTVLTFPKWPFIYQNYVVRVTLAYSDTFLLSRGCHCKRGRLYRKAVFSDIVSEILPNPDKSKR